MKHPEEMNQFDNSFKSMNNQMNMTEDEQKDVLHQINNKMNNKRQMPKHSFTHWKYYFTLVSAALILLILAMPLISTIQNKSEGSNVSQGTQDENTRTIEAVLQNSLVGPK